MFKLLLCDTNLCGIHLSLFWCVCVIISCRHHYRFDWVLSLIQVVILYTCSTLWSEEIRIQLSEKEPKHTWGNNLPKRKSSNGINIFPTFPFPYFNIHLFSFCHACILCFPLVPVVTFLGHPSFTFIIFTLACCTHSCATYLHRVKLVGCGSGMQEESLWGTSARR